MAKKRDRGEKYPNGYIERKIATLVFDHPAGIGEPEIREWLKENYGVGEKKGITNHLQKLKEKEFLILQSEKGKENIWKPCPESKPEILSYICEGMQGDTKEEVVSTFYSWYVQRTIDVHLLPLFGKRHGIIDGYFENGEFVYLTELERKAPEEEEEGVILSELELDVWNFLKKGLKLSPTALSHTLNDLPEVNIAAALTLSAKPNYVDRGLDTRAIAVATLCSCLLIDLAKYPILRGKISVFFRDLGIARTLRTWLDWDFLLRLQDWIPRCITLKLFLGDN